MSESRVQFTGTIDPDGAADEFILGYLARHRGGPVTATQVWKSVHSRGLTPSLGRQTSRMHALPDLSGRHGSTAVPSEVSQNELVRRSVGIDGSGKLYS